MHRTFDIAVPSTYTDTLCHQLEQIDEVIGLSVIRGASVKPRGDVLTVHVLNRGASDVLKRIGAAREHGAFSIATAELASIVDTEHPDAVDRDVDEAIWEEMETGLRHQGRVTANYLLLMARGGGIAATGLIQEGVPQAIAFVSGSVIAPGFEPIAKMPLGLALRRWNVLRRGLMSAGIGYAVLILAAAIMFLILRAAGVADVDAFVHNSEVERLTRPGPNDLMVSACAALAGITMIVAYRRSVIAGPLIALALIPAASTLGVAFAAGQLGIASQAFLRLGIDALLIVVFGVLLILFKQATIHRRAPLV